MATEIQDVSRPGAPNDFLSARTAARHLAGAAAGANIPAALVPALDVCQSGQEV